MYGASQANKRSQALLDAVRKRLVDKAISDKHKNSEENNAEGSSEGSDKKKKMSSSFGVREGDESDDSEEDDLLTVQSDPCAQEHHFHRFGGVGLMFVDMRGGRLLERGGQALDNPIVSQEQWTYMERALSNPEGKRVPLKSPSFTLANFVYFVYFVC